MNGLPTLSSEQLVEYITGRRIIQNEQERALVMLQIHGVYYDYSDEQAMELFERFNRNELTCPQMSYHITLLFSLACNIAQVNEEALNRSKRLLIAFLSDEVDYCYLDEPLLSEDIRLIETFFKELVAVC